MALSPKESILATGSLGFADTLKLWDARTGRPRSTLEGRLFESDSSLAFSLDGRTLASGAEEGP